MHWLDVALVALVVLGLLAVLAGTGVLLWLLVLLLDGGLAAMNLLVGGW